MKIVSKWLVVTILCFSCKCAIGATITAASSSPSAVQSAINSAANGDTVVVPAGNVTWASGVSIPNTKGITLDGTGVAISRGSTSSSLFDLNNSAAGGSRITGFTVTQTTTSDIVGIGGSFSNAKFRIDHCTFTSSASTAVLVRIGMAWGVIDHCTISADNASEMIHNEAWGPSSTGGWSDVVTPGTGDAVYVENCTFSKYKQNDQYFWGTSALQSYYGARTVVRYCLLNYCQLDQHGTSGMVGARWWEFYNNTNVVPSGGGNQSTYMVVRAGSGVIWNNRVIGGKNDGGGGIELVEEDGGYPALYQIGRGQNQSSFPAYVWGNDSPADDPYSGSSNVQLSRDYYQSSPSYSYTPYTYPHPLITASGSGPVNQPPIPKASANSTNGVAPLSVSFSSSGSLDPEGATLSYSWVFGDGGGSNTANPSHTYQSSGVYSATLTVSDGTNTAVSPAIRISVLAPGTNRPPVAAASANVTNGQAPLVVSFSSSGSVDPEGATLTYSWAFGDGGTSTAANPSHTYQAAGTYSARLSVSDGTNSTSSAPLSITVTAVPNDNTTFTADSGSISPPFAVSSGAISQSVETGVSDGGRAVYAFTVGAQGDYQISTVVNAPTTGGNSFFVNIDSDPTDPTMIWDIPVTSGFEARTVSWRGNGVGENDQFVPKSFTLNAGAHQLIVIGREPDVQLQSITIIGKPAPPTGLRVVGP